ncbi:MAG TPA: SCO family protein [Rhodocyclaceae bacterium]
MTKKWINGTVMLAALLAALGGWLMARQGGHHAGTAAVKSATVLNDERSIPPFLLQRLGGTFSNADLAGKWTFLFFGYTQCPDVCPTALGLMRDVRSRLAKAGKPLPEVMFVSVDPARDTLELLANYVPAFDPAFRGATGSDEALAPLVKHFGIFYQRNDKTDPKHYTVDHSAAIYLVGPDGKMKAVFTPPHNPEQVAADYLAITEG